MEIDWEDFFFYMLCAFVGCLCLAGFVVATIVSYGTIFIPFVLGAAAYFWVEHGWRPHTWVWKEIRCIFRGLLLELRHWSDICQFFVVNRLIPHSPPDKPIKPCPHCSRGFVCPVCDPLDNYSRR